MDSNSRVGNSYRDVSGSNSESVYRISNVGGGLKNTISVNILVASSGDTKGILGLFSSRVLILISKAVLTKLILSMELTGGNRRDSNWG